MRSSQIILAATLLASLSATGLANSDEKHGRKVEKAESDSLEKLLDDCRAQVAGIGTDGAPALQPADAFNFMESFNEAYGKRARACNLSALGNKPSHRPECRALRQLSECRRGLAETSIRILNVLGYSVERAKTSGPSPDQAEADRAYDLDAIKIRKQGAGK